MVDSNSVQELEVLLARFPGRMKDELFAVDLLAKCQEISVWADAVTITVEGVRYKAVKERRRGIELTEGVFLIPTRRQALLVVADTHRAYVKMEVFVLALLMTTAALKLSAEDTNARFAHIITTVRALLEG